MGQEGAAEFLDRVVRADRAASATGYLREGKRYVTIAIGCTGGKHRSVAMTEELAAGCARRGVDAVVVHRDLGRE